MADHKHVTRDEKGKVTDTIATYVWTRFLGGEHHDEEIIGRDLKRANVSFGGEEGQTYVRKSRVVLGFRVVAYVDEALPKTRFWPWIVMKEIAKHHPELMQVTKQEAAQTIDS